MPKRTLKTSEEESDGAPKNAGAREASEGDWFCPKCNNLNYKDRDTCNMRSCTPRPAHEFCTRASKEGWACDECGNMNFADRDTCNLRTCGAARPDGTGRHKKSMKGQNGKGKGKGFGGGNAFGMGGGMDVQMAMALGMQMGKAGMGHGQAAQVMAAMMGKAGGCKGGGKKAGGGNFGKSKGPDWICTECNNSNFADRAYCNMKVCNAVRPVENWDCPSCGNTNFANRSTCNLRKCGASRTDLTERVFEELNGKGLLKGKGGKGQTGGNKIA